jgi:hypothetical protein
MHSFPEDVAGTTIFLPKTAKHVSLMFYIFGAFLDTNIYPFYLFCSANKRTE